MKMPNSPIKLPTLNISDKGKEEKVKSIMKPFILDQVTENRIKDVFLEEVHLGLSANPGRTTSLQMENTYISELTDGTEEGTYLALDLGGTNFRVMLITLVQGKMQKEDVAHYQIPENIFLGEGTKLFDFLANSIAHFMHARDIEHQHYNLGFTFSFPMVQKGINVGILTSWTKSFNCSGVVGKDVVQLLNDAIKRKTNLDITVTSVLNDTTGTLVKGSYLDKRCAIGMILATGSNACYIEKVSNIEKWKGVHEEKEEIVDIEWGAFGDNGVLDFLRTKWDNAVDDKSLLKKSFTFEKYISGKYLGDLTREVLVTMATEGLFCSESSEKLESHGALKTKDVAKIESESFTGLSTYTRETLEDLDLGNITDDDIKVVKYVCGVLSYRAVHLISLLTSLLIDRIDKPHCTIAVDGSLYELHPRFKPLMHHLIKLHTPRSFSLILAKDGSGKGAALVAAIEERIRKTKH